MPGGRGGMPAGGMMPRVGGGMPPMRPVGPGAPAIGAGVGAPFKVNYFTHAIVLDLHGGEFLHGRKANSLRLTTPGEILLLDLDGNLVVRDELDDRPACDEITKNDEGAAGAEPPHPAGVHAGAAGHEGALGNMLDGGGTSRRRPSARGGP